MAGRECGDGVVGLCLRVEFPDLDLVVATACDKAADERAVAAVLTGKRSCETGGGPGDGVDAEAVGVEDGAAPVVVAEFEDADVAVGGGAREEAAERRRGPGDHVYRGGV